MDSSNKKIFLYDTTLRDGTQSEDVNFTVIDKLRIAERLIEFGIDCIEGGWPGSNPRDMEFFNALKKNKSIDINKISAFGSTRRAKKTCENDEIIQALLKANVPNITIFGKTWDLHVREALKISLDENIEIIHDTVRYLKSKVDKVYYDAEHFFDGYNANPEYALKTLLAARDAGADCVILCETNLIMTVKWLLQTVLLQLEVEQAMFKVLLTAMVKGAVMPTFALLFQTCSLNMDIIA